MRRGLLVFFLVTVVLLGFAVRQVWTLLALLVEDASADAIPLADLPAPNSSLSHPPPQLIPKIIHQTYINASIPTRWIEAQQSCIDLHPDYEYILWSDASSQAFIAKEYPWFLETFENYPHPIQRADTIRYFVLATYGGVYIDLDDGCERRLDPLLSYKAWLRRTIPTGISNDAMGAVPQHPFFLDVIAKLQGYDHSWILPYITIMASTGPLFLSVLWKHWMTDHADEGPDWAGRVRVLMPDEYSKHAWSFFKENKGDSWHGGDARFIFWMGHHWLLVTALGFMIGGSVLGIVWWVLIGRHSVAWYGYGRHGSPMLIARRGKSRFPFWQWWNGKQVYELVEQHSA